MRCFLGIKLEGNLSRNVQDIKEEFERIGADIKFVERENLHFTVNFLGDIGKGELKRVDSIKEVVEGYEPFPVTVEGTGVFPSKEYIKVIWVGAGEGEEELKELIEDVDDRLGEEGFEREEKDIIPHVTIGRVKSGRKKDEIVSTVERFENKELGEMMIEGVELFESELTSEGPVYKSLKRYEL